MEAVAIDLFSGAGGLTHGLHSAGWNTILAVEFDEKIATTYARNFPTVETRSVDIQEVDFRPYEGHVNLVAGGPPCQPFSVAGKQHAQDDPRDGIPHFMRAVGEINPELFMLENVAGLATKKNFPYLERALAGFRELGYEVEYRILDAAGFGVPQHRRRLIVIGSRIGGVQFPAETHGRGRRYPLVPTKDALQNVPEDLPNNAIVSYAKNPILRPQPFDGMLVNGGGRPINLAEPCQTIPASAGGNRTHIYDPNGVLVEYHRHLVLGGQPRIGLVDGVRRLTVRESARIQSFPDTFCFYGPQSSRYKQVGNAVPPKMAGALGRQLRSLLFG